ncbi:MAG TPA: C1 family peptidase [Bryobacteraceae bacterium]|nr:C1 family peptidase [Bryobacteraceae bacterium]
MPQYWCGDDDFFDDGGGFDDSGDDQGDGNSDDQDDTEDQGDDDQYQDDDQGEDQNDAGDDQGAGDSGGDGGDDGGDGGGDGDDGNIDEQFASEEDLPPVDDDVFGNVDDFPNADEEDFEDDQGDWSDQDYEESAQNLFGDHEYFGDNLVQQKVDEGFQHYEDPAFTRAFDQIAPGTSDTVHLFERDGVLHAFGFVSQAVLALLIARYGGIDMSNLDVAVPPKGEPVPPQPLPPAFANIQEQPAVDLRKYCTPIGDQKQTGRCSAFAWTHALEMSRNILQEDSPRLSPTYTMLEFQRMQGDAQDYRYAWKGGDGTVSGPDPGQVLVQSGTCRQEMWPDDSPDPKTPERQMAADAEQHRLEGVPLPISVEDVRKVLSAGCPVHLAMNTGETFSDVGRDGLFNAAEAPSGMHGRHAMLIVGYTGNFFIVKNSWGSDWGDQGYCYIPKKVLADSDAEFTAILLRRPNQ